MIIHALHTNGYLYQYDTNSQDDRELWFEGRDDIKQAFRTDVTNSPSDYPSVGMEVKLEWVDGYMLAVEHLSKKK